MGEKACFMYFFNMGKGCRWLYGASCITIYITTINGIYGCDWNYNLRILIFIFIFFLEYGRFSHIVEKIIRQNKFYVI